MADFEPFFKPTTSGWRSRWNAIRRFANRWNRLKLGPATAPKEIAGYPIAHELPPSVRQWIVFHEDTKKRPLYRDNVRIERIKSPKSVSIMEIVEKDACWAIRNADLGQDDPPVTTLSEINYTDNFGERWGEPEVAAPSVSEFALHCIIHSLYANAGGCWFAIEEPLDDFQTEMRIYFDRTTRFGETIVFESHGMIAFIYNCGYGGPQMKLELRRKTQREKLPNCIVRNLKDAGKHGCLATNVGSKPRDPRLRVQEF